MNPSRIHFRSAVREDAGALVSVHFAAVHAIAPGHYPAQVLSAWSPPPDGARRSWLANLLAQDAIVCEAAASDAGDVVGFCLAFPDQARLHALYVHPARAGSGIGAGLLRAVEARCRALGTRSLEVNASYNAERFYRANGYARLRETTQSLADGTAMGAVLMSKPLIQAA